MKKRILLVAAIAALFATVTSAQIKFGGGLAYGTEIENIGINARGEYAINEKIAITPGLTVYLPKDDVNMLEFNIDGHYAITDMFYGLGGLNYTHYKVVIPTINFGGTVIGGGDFTDSAFGLNIGGGANFGKMFFGEVKYVLSDYDQLVLTVGVLFGGK